MKKTILIAAALMLSVGVVHANQLKIATGSATGTYSKMLKEMNNVCANDVIMLEQNTTGSPENMDLLIGNAVNGAIVQTDVLWLRARTEELGNVKTLIALHPEEVHVVALTTSVIKGKGKLGTSFGAEPLVFNSLSDLAGQKVAAWGGSATTARVIKLQSDINFVVEEVSDLKAAQAALKEGRVAAIIMVGGAPMEAITKLTAEYKLVPINEATIAKLKSVYKPARLNYRNLGAAGIPTVSTDALFVTREYKSAKFVTALGKFRSCVMTNLDELKETTGTHPKWQAVDAANKGKWPYYEIK